MLSVLLVDDELAVVNGLKKALRPWREQFSVDVAIGGPAALKAIDAFAYDVVVTDARMPEVDGEGVLAHATERRPASIRLVLSGQVDAKTAHRLAFLAHQFLPKPTTAAALVTAIDECQKLVNLLDDEVTRSAVLAQRSLPAPPRTYQRICALCESSTASTDEVCETIRTDAAITASVLRVANSAFYGGGHEVERLGNAVKLLGLARVREIVLVAELFGGDDPLGLLETLRARSAVRAKAARLLTVGTSVVELRRPKPQRQIGLASGEVGQRDSSAHLEVKPRVFASHGRGKRSHEVARDQRRRGDSHRSFEARGRALPNAVEL